MRLVRNGGPAALRSTAVALAVFMGTGALPLTATAGVTPLPLLVKKKKKKKFTPEQAADQRMPIQDEGRQMVEAGELTAATILYDGAANSQGDPILFLDAGDTYLEMAIVERDIASAETAKERAYTARDILYFHTHDASSDDYRVVTDDEIGGLLSRSSELIAKADDTIAEIEAEQEALSEPPPAPEKAKGDGKGMRIAGIGFMALGVAGLGAGAAGLVIGQVNQNRVNDDAVYGAEFDDFDARGRRGNLIAGVGLAVGGTALVAGTVLFIIGKRRGKKAGEADEPAPSDDASVAVVPTGRGLALVGRF
ncbi:MAG: hypothetical protein AAF799_13055 [Myxococcota bacterium]